MCGLFVPTERNQGSNMPLAPVNRALAAIKLGVIV